MTDEQPIPSFKGPAPSAELQPPAAAANPDDIAVLALEYQEGRPLITFSGGTTLIPSLIVVADESGAPVAAYAAVAVPDIRLTNASIDVLDGDDESNLLVNGSLVLGYQGWLAGAQLAYDTTEGKLTR